MGILFDKKKIIRSDMKQEEEKCEKFARFQKDFQVSKGKAKKS